MAWPASSTETSKLESSAVTAFRAVLNVSRCFCGNELQNSASLNNTGCNMPCSGDASQYCGGLDRLSVFKNTEFRHPIVREVVDNYVSLGCFKEGKTERALSDYSFVDPEMTPELCIGGCLEEGYAYAGVEYSTECYCASHRSNQTMSAPIGECNMLCAGNKKTYCGGANRLIIYNDITVEVLFLSTSKTRELRLIWLVKKEDGRKRMLRRRRMY